VLSLLLYIIVAMSDNTPIAIAVNLLIGTAIGVCIL
jgi:hypothetical protein